METYQERVVVEKDELDAKISKLHNFIGSEAFEGISAAEQKRLRRQDFIMQLYSEVLSNRLAAFV